MMRVCGPALGPGALGICLFSVAAFGHPQAGRPAAPSDTDESASIARRQQSTAASAVPNGPDVTFCQLYGLTQYGRVGSVVGLAMATTSWNIGGSDLAWFADPNWEHPYIVQNLYRLKDDRLEQIGQSWIKHGFFALDHEQCGTECTYEAGHGQGEWLGVGCTDTYTAFLNADQDTLGPREEVNPWAGVWDTTGHHNASAHAHTAIDHRLQVHDDDLNPALNSGATYYAEGYYVHFEDIDVMNSTAWKPVTVSGSPGGTWSFGMSSAFVLPNIGFAIDAWPGATQTVIAQELPVEEFVSPDGRCLLASKATDLSGGTWHYEYALYNVDMERKVGSFTVAFDPAKTPTNIGFHAVASHGESYSNDPWTVEISEDCPAGHKCITWSTEDNPLRWGTMYNFRFDIDAPPQGGAVAAGGGGAGSAISVGLFEPGSPESLMAAAVGPEMGGPIPTIGAWGAAVLALLVGIAGTIRLGRSESAIPAA